MSVQSTVKSNVYFDSLVLMRLTNRLEKHPGVRQAVVMMGTEENKGSIRDQSLLTTEAREATPDDLFIVVEAETEAEAQDAIQHALDSLRDRDIGGRVERQTYATLDAAVRQAPEANLASISVPGKYASAEAERALEAGLHVFLFSDNVPVEEEVKLKRKAGSEGLLMMGPDCGTAILGGAALGFANAVRPGPVGIVGASGTGLQEVSTLIHRLGSGITQAIGTGTHDVGAEVGGHTLIEGIKWFAQDPDTGVILVVSKPSSPSVSERIQEVVTETGKPVVMIVLGADLDEAGDRNVLNAPTMEDAALMSVALGLEKQLNTTQRALYDLDELRQVAQRERSRLKPGQVYYRGLFCGGTYANESALILMEALGETVHGNISLSGVRQLEDPWKSEGHTCVDMGEDVFTVGKPHPILAPSLRRDRLMEEASDPNTGVVFLDVILGYGTHADPAAELATYIKEAMALASEQGRHLPVIVNVCGVDEDPQDRSRQVDALRESGAIVAPTNAAATRLAAAILTGEFAQSTAPSIDPESPAEPGTSWASPFALPKKREVHIINDGLAAFAESYREQEIPVTEVDFRPPAGGDEELADLLSEML
jgi:FdrA protein